MNPIGYALACASLLSGLPWDGSEPQVKQSQEYSLPVSGGLDREGHQITSSAVTLGLYDRKTNTLSLAKDTSKSTLVHEATHYLQNLNGMPFGSPQFQPNQRAAIEKQAYLVEEQAPFSCIGLFGGWRTNQLDQVRKVAKIIKPKDQNGNQ